MNFIQKTPLKSRRTNLSIYFFIDPQGSKSLGQPAHFFGRRKPAYLEKTQYLRQSVDSFHMRSGFESHIEKTLLMRIEPATLEVKGEWFNYFATVFPFSGGAMNKGHWGKCPSMFKY